MGIGTSLGAFHEDDFRHEAAPWFLDPKDDNVIDPEVDPGGTQPLSNPVIPVSNHAGFVGSSNIEDRRDEPNPHAVEWKNVIPSIKDLGEGVMRNITGPPFVSEKPATKLGVEAGLEDIHIEKNVGTSLLEDIMNDVTHGWKITKDFADAFRKVIINGEDNPADIKVMREEMQKVKPIKQ